jgi:hypothetical protein
MTLGPGLMDAIVPGSIGIVIGDLWKGIGDLWDLTSEGPGHNGRIAVPFRQDRLLTDALGFKYNFEI